MATTLYYGISGTTLTISRTSTTAAPTRWSTSSGTEPPWYAYRNIITTLNFVNTPVINDLVVEVPRTAPGNITYSETYLLFTGNGNNACLCALKTITGTFDMSGVNSSTVPSLYGLFAGSPVETVDLPNCKVGYFGYFLWRNVCVNSVTGRLDYSAATEGSALKSVSLRNWKYADGNPVKVGTIGNSLFGVLSDSIETLDITGWKVKTAYSIPFRLNRTAMIYSQEQGTNVITYFGPPVNLKTLNLTNVDVGTVDMSEAFKGCTSLKTLTLTGFACHYISSTTGSVRVADNMFQGCSSLTSVDLSGVVTSITTTAQGLFDGCTSITSVNLTGWNPAGDYSRMFYGCARLRTITGFLTTTHVYATNMTDMFCGCASLQGSIDLSTWNCHRVTQAEGMFDGCASLTSITLMALSLASAARMFRGCASLTTLDVTALDLSACTDLSEMFAGCSALTSLDAHGLALTACTNILGMFTGDVALTTLDVSGWSTPAITSMAELFANLTHLTSLNLASWDTEDVTSMVGLFYNCTALASVNISGFDTSNVTNFAMATNNVGSTFKPMFRGCDNLVTVVLGSGFTTAAARALDDPANLLFYSRLELAPVINLGNGVYVESDGSFAQLRSTEIAGTWRRGGSQMLSVFAYRTDDGQPDEQGLDITIDSMWRTTSSSSTRVLRIYIKASTTPNYPTTPTRTVTLAGDQGQTIVTLANVGSGNYDLRVEFYDGEATYVAFPSISTDTLLFYITPQGSVRVLANLELGGTLTLGTTTMNETQLKALLRLV